MTKMLSEFLFYKDRQVIFSHAEVIESLHNFSEWKRKAWRQFSIKLHDSEFPCIFSKSAWKAKSIKFVFCEKRKDSEYLDFLHGLVSYSDYINDTPLSKRLLSPLVVFFSPEYYINKNQHETGWEALNWAHARDSKPWPENISVSPEDAEWTFYFNGIQFFINMSTQNHRILRNRNLGAHLTFVINARENFDAVANGNTKAGRQLREHIRERVREYNGGVFPSELGFYGDDANLEWKQYQLEESGTERPQQCPFRHRKTT